MYMANKQFFHMSVSEFFNPPKMFCTDQYIGYPGILNPDRENMSP